MESSHEVQEVVVSGDLAYAWTALEVRVFPLAGGIPMQRSGSALSILRKDRQGDWVMVRDASVMSATL